MSQDLEGGRRGGAVRYRVTGEPLYAALCPCADCRKSAGAPRSFTASGASVRNVCPTRGTGLFFTNAQTLPGLVDIQAATLDGPEALPPQVQMQAAERLGRMAQVEDPPAFERYPATETPARGQPDSRTACRSSLGSGLAAVPAPIGRSDPRRSCLAMSCDYRDGIV